MLQAVPDSVYIDCVTPAAVLARSTGSQLLVFDNVDALFRANCSDDVAQRAIGRLAELGRDPGAHVVLHSTSPLLDLLLSGKGRKYSGVVADFPGVVTPHRLDPYLPVTYGPFQDGLPHDMNAAIALCTSGDHPTARLELFYHGSSRGIVPPKDAPPPLFGHVMARLRKCNRDWMWAVMTPMGVCPHLVSTYPWEHHLVGVTMDDGPEVLRLCDKGLLAYDFFSGTVYPHSASQLFFAKC